MENLFQTFENPSYTTEVSFSHTDTFFAFSGLLPEKPKSLLASPSKEGRKNQNVLPGAAIATYKVSREGMKEGRQGGKWRKGRNEDDNQNHHVATYKLLMALYQPRPL